jgi:RHS repeat-associated protein
MKCTGNPCVGTLYWTGTGSGPLAESSGSTFTEEYAFFNGKRVARRDLPGGAVHYYFSDHLGSASVVTDTSGSVQKESDYYPFGGEMVVSGGDINNYKFTGKERDAESGLDDFGARYYGSSTGRFMSPDWAERATAVPYATLASPQSLNLFSYVSDNPLGRTDPDGHRCAPGGSICDSAKGLSSDAQAAENQYLAMVAQSTQEAQNTQTGVAATQTYKTRDDAARAAEKAALNATDKSGRKYEYGGWILKNKDGQYTYTIAITFKDQGHFYPDRETIPTGFTGVADYHTHRHNTHEEGPGFSRDDEDHGNFYGRTGYVADTYSRDNVSLYATSYDVQTKRILLWCNRRFCRPHPSVVCFATFLAGAPRRGETAQN